MSNFPILLVSSAMICIETYDTFVSCKKVCTGEDDTFSIVPVDIYDILVLPKKVCVETHDTFIPMRKSIVSKKSNTLVSMPVVYI